MGWRGRHTGPRHGRRGLAVHVRARLGAGTRFGPRAAGTWTSANEPPVLTNQSGRFSIGAGKSRRFHDNRRGVGGFQVNS